MAISKRDHGSLPRAILILASDARSGSTLLAELLSTSSNAVLFYEPFWPYKDKPEFFSDGERVSEYLRNIFTCKFNKNVEALLREVLPFSQYYHPDVLQCLSEWAPMKCLENLDLRAICHNAIVRVAKVVRARLSWVEDLLQRSSELDIKVIHLLRDPRGSITSMQGLFWNWDPSLKCSHLWEDMQHYDHLIQLYPDRLTNVTHEELSLNPENTMKRLNHFLYGTSELSADTLWYIKKHMSSNRYEDDPMSTYSDSKNKFQSWRWKINGRLLSEIEAEPTCRLTIEKYGHNLFGSLDRATDPRIPLSSSEKGPDEDFL